jgi:hypothetical protein
MKSNEVGTTLKHLETINGNVKNLSKRTKMNFLSFYFKNLTLPLIASVFSQTLLKKNLNFACWRGLVTTRPSRYGLSRVGPVCY